MICVRERRVTFMIRLSCWLCTIAALVFLINSANAASHDESIDGDLSGSPGAPTSFFLANGANTLTGIAGIDNSNDYDIVAFTVPVGHQLDSLVLHSFAFIQGNGPAFLGLQSGSTWTAGLGFGVDAEELLGGTHLSVGQVGSDLLPGIGSHPSIPNSFVPPLSSGVYTMLLQDFNDLFSYGFTFNVSPVPEPSAIVLAALGFVGAAAVRRFRRRRASGV